MSSRRKMATPPRRVTSSRGTENNNPDFQKGGIVDRKIDRKHYTFTAQLHTVTGSQSKVVNVSRAPSCGGAYFELGPGAGSLVTSHQ